MSQNDDFIFNEESRASTDKTPAPDLSALSKKLINKTVNKTLQAIDFASDTTGDMLDFVGQATDFTKETLDQVTHKTKRSVSNLGIYSANAVRGVVSETSEVARDVSLHMARTFLGKTPLTLYLPEMLLNNQIRKRIDPTEIDNIKVEFGIVRSTIQIDGHYLRFLYRLTLNFNVLECRIGQEKFLRLKQTDESLDLQIRHAGTLTNWATRRVGKVGFNILNILPIATLINHIIRDIPGIQQEKHRHWYIDLEKAGFIDFINNRSWMMDKLINLTDFSILPGLNILRESQELMRQLVDQFEICGLRVQSGRLEVQVRISQSQYQDFVFK